MYHFCIDLNTLGCLSCSSAQVKFISIVEYQFTSFTFFKIICSAYYHRRELVTSNEFEILVLSQIWPQTSCWDVNEFWNRTFGCSPCAHPNTFNNWTLHGLWPSNKHGGNPEHCNHDMKFRLANLDENLRVQLNDKWHTSKVGKRNAEFWKHEWEKHGTCSMELENTGSMNNYFNQSLFLLDHYNVGQILSGKNITPGNEYGALQIYDAIHSSLNVRPFIMCARNPVSICNSPLTYD